MKLSISNIAWSAENDASVYKLMREMEFAGLEIAPTRIFPETPYDQLDSAAKWSAGIGFAVPSMQSIWYGKSGNIFCDNERGELIEYTRKAVDFAESIGCRNMVFGCPRNRQIPGPEYKAQAVAFFREIGVYASEHHCVIGMEANPAIYNTNFINTTAEALELVKEVDTPGFMLNLDVGTMVYNKESVELLHGQIPYISHVHISEPYLKLIEKRDLHQHLAELLREEHYAGYVSIEMGKQENIEDIRQTMAYVKGIFQ